MQTTQTQLVLQYRLRWKRRRLLFRSVRKRRQLTSFSVKPSATSCHRLRGFICARNEVDRLPWWLEHHRNLGIEHFYCVVNNSDDGTAEYLAEQPDCSVWITQHSYKNARFGMDWVGWLLWRYGAGAWCLTLDADELFVYPHWDTQPLSKLVDWLDETGQIAFGAPMLDLYPKGRLADMPYVAGTDPLHILKYYDAWNTTHIRQQKHLNQWIQGGPRARQFFAAQPERAPTLNKIPLVNWRRSYAYVTSTHIMLPRHLNSVFDANAGLPVIGALLHTKFLDNVVIRSAEPAHRAEHFENSLLYHDYYETLMGNPSLWHDDSKPYRGWRGLAEDGVLWRTSWGNNE